MDRIDQLLTTAFDDALTSVNALTSVSDVDLIESVMVRIRARQRQRFIVMTAIGLLATAICVISGLPLLGLIADALSTAGQSDWSIPLPTLVAVLAAAMGVGLLHLLMEDSI